MLLDELFAQRTRNYRRCSQTPKILGGRRLSCGEGVGYAMGKTRRLVNHIQHEGVSDWIEDA
jgi:hypothetical protein